MSNEDKSEFEFIESPGSPKKLSQGSRPSSRPVKMWVLFENDRNEDAEKFVLREADFNNDEEFFAADLNDFKNVLRKNYPFLKDVGNRSITFFNESLERLDPSTNLSTLNVDDAKIIVRYLLSSLNIKVNLKFVNNRKASCNIMHSTGSFAMLQDVAKSKFEVLADCILNDVYFEHQGENIENARDFGILVRKFKNEDEDELRLDLKVLIRNRKSYGDWKLEDVFKDIYDRDSSNLDIETDKFNLEDLPQLSKTISNKELNRVIKQISDKEFAFDYPNTNEATAREFISVILVNAVCFVKRNIDSTTKLMVENQLAGSHGYGPLDYTVMIRKFFLLITEAKPHEPGKGIAQNLVQIDSAYEMLGKRRFDETGNGYESMETMPIIGIVTTGEKWVFIRHTYQNGSRRLEMSETIKCKLFAGGGDDVVFSYVVRLINYLAEELEKRKVQLENK